MNLIMKSSFLLILFLCGCNTLDVQENYCEIAFAYPIDIELPSVLARKKVGCACTKKDILKGEEVGQWVLQPLEKCRRVRGFHPRQWKDTIDPFFQFQYKKRAK